MGSGIRDIFPLTFAGVFLLAACVFWGWWEGVGSADLILLIAGFALLVLLLLLLGLVVLSALILKIKLRSAEGGELNSSLTLEADRWQSTGFSLKAPTWLPLVQFDWTWSAHPDDVELSLEAKKGLLLETVLPRRRGILESLERRLTIRDSFRLTSLSLRFTREQTVIILPSGGRGAQLNLLQNLVSGEDLSDPRGDPGGDRIDMRQYTKGDSPRIILWKVFARSRKLMVKIPERAVTARPRSCAYQIAGPEDSAAASLSRDILEHQLLGDGWRFGADGSAGHFTGVEEALTSLARSGNDSARHEPSSLSRFLKEAEQAGYACCFVLLGSRIEHRRQELEQALRGTRMKVVLCLVVQGLRQGLASPWRRWLVWEEPGDDVDLTTLDMFWAQWRSSGCEIRLIDRSNGSVYRDIPALTRILREKSGG